MENGETGFPRVVVRAGDVSQSVTASEPLSSETLAVIRSLVPLVTNEGGRMRVKYNFSHLSRMLGVDKRVLYARLVEAYYEDVRKAGNSPVRGETNSSRVFDTAIANKTRVKATETRSIMVHPVPSGIAEFEPLSPNSSSSGSLSSDSRVNLNAASGFLHHHRLGLRDPSSDIEEASLESLLLEEEVLKQI